MSWPSPGQNRPCPEQLRRGRGTTISRTHSRTDIPAFYAEWMVRRLREGYCTVANPFNRNQVSCISLRPEDVDAIVFWTRNPRPLMPYFDELDSRGYRYYFQFTILGYPRQSTRNSPPPRPPSGHS